MTALVKALNAKYNFISDDLHEDAAEIMEDIRAHIDIEQLVEDNHCHGILIVSRPYANVAYGHVFSDSLGRFEDADFVHTSRIAQVEVLDTDLEVLITRNTRYLVVKLA
jgi:hypothetical protein